jgi:hypothetical protein
LLKLEKTALKFYKLKSAPSIRSKEEHVPVLRVLENMMPRNIYLGDRRYEDLHDW